MGLTVRAVRHAYVGGLNGDTAVADLEALLGEKVRITPMKFFNMVVVIIS